MMKIPVNIAIKLGLLISVLMIGMAIVLSWYFLTSSSKLLHEELIKRGVEIVCNLGSTSKDGIVTENLFCELDPLIEAARLNTDIAFVAILNRYGRILAHTDSKEIGKVYRDKSIREALLSKKAVCLGESKEIIRFVEVVRIDRGKDALLENNEGSDIEDSGIIGAVLLGISLKGLQVKTNNILQVSSGVILLLVAIGVILSFFFSTRITAPIRALTHTMEDICRGNLDAAIKPELLISRDEISIMASSFNRMKDNILQLINALKESNQELEKRVDERTMEAKQKAALLEKTVEELTMVNQELDSFVYTASHDLKEPLRAIETFSNFILEDYWEKLDAEGKDYLKRISAGAHRLKDLIDALLAYSRITRGKVQCETIDLSRVIRDALKRLEHIIEERGMDIRVRKDIPVIYGDSTKLCEVFYNLISNAIKYNDKEKPIIEIDCPIPQPKEDEVMVFVKDNGIGIDTESRDEVFKIFKRLHTRNEYGGGAGAGLAIVKKIMDDHGARIWIEDMAGEGTMFCLSFPKKAVREDTCITS
ncbi:MAG: ATP-binding protein [bacterium]|nr:ATP-binding protein [bacterium]